MKHSRSPAGFSSGGQRPYPDDAASQPASDPARPQAIRIEHRTIYAVRGRPGPDDRPALPAGHPETWDRINEGTCIAGAPYPFPIFLP